VNASFRVRSAVLLAALLVSCSTSTSPRSEALPARASVPLATVDFSGNRYILPVKIDQRTDAVLMVHGNSTMYLSVIHHVGDTLNGGPVPKIEDYGYSSRGRGVVRVKRIDLGGVSFSGDREVPVFDFAEDGDTPVEGMLGVPFLLDARAAVDFAGDRLLLGVEDRDEPEARLLERGYRWVPIAIGSRGRATVEARFPVIGRALPITPSTVSTALTLHHPLFEGKVPMTRSSEEDRSPRGTTPDEFHAERVTFEIAGATMTSPASFEDLAEYGKVSERDLESFGMLGFDWMKEHRAVIDYANRRLYFKP
jgi:hypothetical protein